MKGPWERWRGSKGSRGRSRSAGGPQEPGAAPPDPGRPRRLEAELAGEREASRALQRQLAAEVQVARRAAEEVLRARAEREEYRRVLAAAIANEKRALAESDGSRRELASAAETVRDAEHARGVAEGRSRELELQLAAAREEHRRELAAAEERTRTAVEQSRREMDELTYQRGLARGELREVLRRIPPELPPSARAAVLRARTCVAAGTGAGVLALGFLPALVLALFTHERAEYLRLAVGLSAGEMLLVVGLLVVAAVGLFSWGARELRSSERAARAARSGGSDAGSVTDPLSV